MTISCAISCVPIKIYLKVLKTYVEISTSLSKQLSLSLLVISLSRNEAFKLLSKLPRKWGNFDSVKVTPCYQSYPITNNEPQILLSQMNNMKKSFGTQFSWPFFCYCCSNYLLLNQVSWNPGNEYVTSNCQSIVIGETLIAVAG